MRRSILLLALFALVPALDQPAAVAQAPQCGIPPIPPIPPIGCRRMEPICQCSTGYPTACSWQFVCVPY